LVRIVAFARPSLIVSHRGPRKPGRGVNGQYAETKSLDRRAEFTSRTGNPVRMPARKRRPAEETPDD